MVERLLQTDVVLSARQIEFLTQAGLNGAIGDLVTGKVGVLTFLGTDNTSGKTVYFLLRLEEGEYHTPVVPMAIEKVFGEKFSVMYGNDRESPWRVLVTCELDQPLRNPLGVLRAKSRKLAAALVSITIEEEEKLFDYDDWREEMQQEAADRYTRDLL
jgi:hypothetical protein